MNPVRLDRLHYEETRNAIYDYLRQQIAHDGYVPTQRDIARACYLAPSTVRYHLRVMEAQGRIQYWHGVWRGIRLTEGKAA